MLPRPGVVTHNNSEEAGAGGAGGRAGTGGSGEAMVNRSTQVPSSGGAPQHQSTVIICPVGGQIPDLLVSSPSHPSQEK